MLKGSAVEFYLISAEILPVLLLALVWDARYLEKLAKEKRKRRRHGETDGVWFWTKGWIRVYTLVATTWMVFGGIGLSVLVLADEVPKNLLVKSVVLVALAFALFTLITRIWADVITATAKTEGDS